MCLEKHAPPTGKKCKRINKIVDSEHANRNEHVNTNETLPIGTEDNINDSVIFPPPGPILQHMVQQNLAQAGWIMAMCQIIVD